MTSENLWGELPNVAGLRTPLTILREQASHLAKISRGLLEAEVEVRNLANQTTVLTLRVIAPTLDSYSVTLAQIDHGLGFYPLVLQNSQSHQVFEVAGEARFKQVLKAVLSSAEVQAVLRALLAQMEAGD